MLPVDVMTLVYSGAVLGLSISAVSFLVYQMHPVLFLHIYFRISVIYSGMRLKYTEVDGLNICYGERGSRQKSRPSMVLMHGFTADKFMWTPLVRKLPSDVHVIAVDLPGHGDSDTPPDSHDLSHEVTVKKMHQLIVKTGMNSEPFHLVGMSMGGALAGLYAASYPQEIHSLTMICPAMRTPIESPFWKTLLVAVEAGIENLQSSCGLLFPTTADEVQYMLDYVQYHRMWVPKQILHGVAEFRKRYYPFYIRLFQTIVEPRMHTLLEDHLHKITAPTQVIWGDSDQVLHVSGADLVQKHLPNCVTVDIISRCGHSMTTDRPGALTKAIVNFRKQTQADR